MVCEYEAVLALFVHVQFAHFRPAQVVLVVVNDAEIALCRAVSLLCKLLLDYELALRSKDPQLVVLQCAALDEGLWQIFETDVLELERIERGHFVVLESIFVLVYQMVGLDAHRREVHVFTVTPRVQ